DVRLVPFEEHDVRPLVAHRRRRRRGRRGRRGRRRRRRRRRGRRSRGFATEVERQRAQDRVRPEPRVHFATVRVDERDVVGVEEAIAQTDGDAVGQRGANAGKSLPREARVRIVEHVDTTNRRVEAGARNTGTGTDEALQAVVFTEVGQRVQHEREGAGVTTGAELVAFGGQRV